MALVGEAAGEVEARLGEPFKGPAGFKLTRLIEWAGLDRAQFDIWNVAWCRPPGNRLEGEHYEYGAVGHCKHHHWSALVDRVNVVVPLGNVPLHALTGRKGILTTRGYLREGWGRLVLPTIHPSYIQRGNSNFAPVFINDLVKAVRSAAESPATVAARLAAVGQRYILDPSPEESLRIAQRIIRELAVLGSTALLSYDIETPWKSDDESEGSDGAGDEVPNRLSEDTQQATTILRIGFSANDPARTTISIPWSGEYLPTIRRLLECDSAKVVWNTGFDTPRIRQRGVGIHGIIHDGMIAWHVLHSDLPKGLGFVATFTCPDQPEWKHLNSAKPAFYNATDAEVELKSMEAIQLSLEREGMWSVYKNDVLDLEPILAHMSACGMPIDAAVREDRAIKLAERQNDVLVQLELLYPAQARKVAHIYKNPPKDLTGLSTRPAVITQNVCSVCGLVKPPKAHFRVLKKKLNPCAHGGAVERDVEGIQYFRLAPFRPSRNQLVAYQAALKRLVPTQWDGKLGKRKPSMNEKSIKSLMAKYPLDKFYPLVLEYRELDKLAGTYIGRPMEPHDAQCQHPSPDLQESV